MPAQFALGCGRGVARRLAGGGLPPRRLVHTDKFFINGTWRPPVSSTATQQVVDPSSGEAVATLALGAEDDVELAVQSARAAFDSWSLTPKAERLDLLQRLLELYKADAEAMATAISTEMGAPIKLARSAQTAAGLGHIQTCIRVLSEFQFEERPLGAHEVIRHEPIGGCGARARAHARGPRARPTPILCDPA